MNLLDLIIAVLVLIFCIEGFRRGLVREVISLVSFLVGFVITLRVYVPVSQLIDQIIGNQSLSQVLSFLGTYLIILWLGHLAGKFLTGLVKVVFLGGMNKLLGLLFGLAKGTILAAVLVYLVSAYVVDFQPVVDGSFLGAKLKEVGDTLFSLAPQYVKKYLEFGVTKAE